MKNSVFIPLIKEDFEVHYWSKDYQSHDWVNPTDSEKTSRDLESLFQLHSHDAMEILVFLGGECEFFCEGKTYSLTKGDVVIIPPYAVHKADITDHTQYERIVTSISKALLTEYLSISPSMKESIIYNKTKGTYVIHLHPNKLKQILMLYQEVSERVKMQKTTHAFGLHYLLFQAVQIILHPDSSEPTNRLKDEQDQRLHAIIEYVETHLQDPDLNLENVSNHFHLNKYYFSHYFKKHMNISFYRYVLLKRLATAVTLMKENEYSIETIATKCGFKDYSSFYRLFKKEYNLSPKNVQKGFR